MKKILITGGAGFIGYHLANFHSKNGDYIIIIDNLGKDNQKIDSELNKLIKKPNVDFIQCDLTDKTGSIDLPKNIDVVYHLAAMNGTELFYEIPYELCRNNILLTINLLDILKNINIKKIVYTSTSEVYAGGEKFNLVPIPTNEEVPILFPQPTDKRFSYATSKFIGEFLSFNFGDLISVPTTVVRFHNIYGPRMGYRHVIPQFIERAIKCSEEFQLYGANNTRAFCFIDDAIKAITSVATNKLLDKKIIHIGNQDEEIKMIELAKCICRLMNKKFIFLDKGAPNMSVNRRCPDTKKLYELVGYKASTPLLDGLKITIDWYKKDSLKAL